MEERRPYWNMEMETKLNTPEMKEIQWKKLKKQINYLYHVAPLWKSRLDKAGVTPEKIKTWEDFQKRVPVFTKEQYRDYAEECDGDMDRILEGLLGENSKKLVLIAATSGTTGEPTPYAFTESDRYHWGEYCKRAAWRCGVYPGDKILHGFGLSMFVAGVPVIMSFIEYGACVIPVGAEAGTDQIIKYLNLFKPKAMACTPSLTEYMIQKAPEITGRPVDALNLKVIISGGEPGAGIPEVRKKIEEAFRAKLYDLGGGGVSCDYPVYQGMHYVWDDLTLFELVDPATYEHVPLEDGAKGLIAHSQLEGLSYFAGLRQSSNDIMEVFTSPCPCGNTGFRFKIIGRADDMLKVKGVMIYPPALEGVINGFVPKVTGEFRIVLDEPPPRVVPPLKLKVEYGLGIKEEQLEVLAEEIVEEMHRRVKIRPKIIWIPPNSLERFLKKKKLFERTYEKK
jgi:phenylacetate-CoA ligase